MREPVKMQVMSIVHGQSEYCICTSIRSNLRLKHEIIARDKGKTSIQVTSVMDILNDNRYKDYDCFIRYFPDVEHKKSRLFGFTLFIIMDVEDCTAEQKNKYINKAMFRGHWLNEYIVPIYNDPKLEATMKEANIKYKHKEIKDKSEYITIFPTNHGDLDINIAREYLNKLKNCKCSNLDKYFEHCILLAEKLN